MRQKHFLLMFIVAFVFTATSVWAIVSPDKTGTYTPTTSGKSVNLTSVFKSGNLSGPLAGDDATIARSFFSGKSASEIGVQNVGKDMRIMSIKKNDLGSTFIRVQQNYNGVPVYGGEIIIEVGKDRTVQSVSGNYARNLNVSTTPKLTSSSAFKYAKDDLRVGDANEDNTNPQLYVYCTDKGNHLVWKTTVWTNENGPGKWEYFIDAHTGEIVNKYNDIQFDNPATATATTLRTVENPNGKSVTIGTYYFTATGRYEMYDKVNDTYGVTGGSSSAYIKTWNAGTAKKNDCTALTKSTRDDPTVFYSSNNVWTDAAGVSAHYYSGKVFSYYKSAFGRESIDGSGMNIHSVVHYDVAYDNAYWNGYCMTYGDGSGTHFTNLAGALDVVAHEMTHGVTDYESDLVYQNESGALNEYFSDAFGTVVESWVENGGDWMIGEDITVSGGCCYPALRFMDDPRRSPGEQPSTKPNNYLTVTTDSYWYSGTGDNGGVHTNGGPAQKAFYLMWNGGTHNGFTVTGIGRDKTATIAYYTNANRLTSTANYDATALAHVAEAEARYGVGSPEAIATKTAWHAIGAHDFGLGNGSGTGGGGTGDTPVAITAGPSTSNITSTGATITWTTNVASDSRVDYGTTTSYGSSATNASLVTNHSITLSGLTAGTTYNYKVTSGDGKTSAVSGNFTFTTLTSSGDTYEPNGTTTSAFGPIASGTTYTSYIYSAGEIDYFYFNLSYGGTINISLDCPTGKDYDWYLYDPSLKLKKSGATTADPENGSYSTTSTDKAGKWYIKVVGYNNAYSTSLPYTLTVTYPTGGALTVCNDVPPADYYRWEWIGSSITINAGSTAFLYDDGCARYMEAGFYYIYLNANDKLEIFDDARKVAETVTGPFEVWTLNCNTGIASYKGLYYGYQAGNNTTLCVKDGKVYESDYNSCIIKGLVSGSSVSMKVTKNSAYNPYVIVDSYAWLSNISASAVAGPDKTTLPVSNVSGERVKSPVGEIVIASSNKPITSNAPLTFALDQNKPNPFNPTTTISYTIPEKANVSLKIYNNVGQLVKVLVDEVQNAGTMSVVWDGKDDRGQTVSSGLYYYRLVSGNYVASRKMLLLK